MKKHYPYPFFAREGWFYMGTLSIAVLASLWWGWWWSSLPLFLLWAFVVQFFRDPPRSLPEPMEGGVLCPADGRVIAIEQTEDPYLSRPALKVSIFMNVFDVHANRAPVSGSVRQNWYYRGRFFNASLDKASLENERNALWLQTAPGQDVTVVQVAGLVARRILCYVREGEEIRIGQRFGFIRFGSRVDTYLPPESTVLVHLGERVHSGSRWIARLPKTVAV